MPTSGTSRPDYAIVTGQGRSGTNWLLELFDFSPETFCRNEPYGVTGSPLAELSRDRFVIRQSRDELARRWDGAVLWTARHMGARDRPIGMPKSFIFPLSRWLGLYRVARAPRLRSALARRIPGVRKGEWSLPWWTGSRSALARAFPLLKLVASPGWVDFVLRDRPGIPVFHIVRHPGGFLSSWANRYLATEDREKVARDNRRRLHDVADADARWAERFDDIEAMSVEESELWYWWYANQVVFEAGRGSEHYHHIVYEDLARDPVPLMKRLYAACGLVWSDEIERAIESSGSRSTSIAAAWREKLEPRERELVQRFLLSDLSFYPRDEGVRSE